MKIAVVLAVILASIAGTHGCKCIPLRDPAECRTQYLMLVKITGLVVDPVAYTRRYTFDLIEDISYPALSSQSFSYIQTGWDHGSCQLDLQTGTTYLLGGSVDYANNLLYASTCGTYVKEWDATMSKEASKLLLKKIQKRCARFHLSGSVTISPPTGGKDCLQN